MGATAQEASNFGLLAPYGPLYLRLAVAAERTLAIRAVEDAIGWGQRDLLVAMATGTGNTRTTIAEPRRWYAMRRAPRIVERDPERGRVLVELTATELFGGFGGTCLYARRDTEWACYTIKPNAARSIADAEAWLVKRDWEDWG